jgi:hypothetical protein
MNAYELADKLEADYWDSRTNKIMLESATMLRQQQAEIEALKQSKSEGNNKVKTVAEIMSENCTCYKLGYSPLNDYAKVKAK